MGSGWITEDVGDDVLLDEDELGRREREELVLLLEDLRELDAAVERLASGEVGGGDDCTVVDPVDGQLSLEHDHVGVEVLGRDVHALVLAQEHHPEVGQVLLQVQLAGLDVLPLEPEYAV